MDIDYRSPYYTRNRSMYFNYKESIDESSLTMKEIEKNKKLIWELLWNLINSRNSNISKRSLKKEIKQKKSSSPNLHSFTFDLLYELNNSPLEE